jgi:hypothetical protein
MKTNPTLARGLLVNHKVGRATPCPPQLPKFETARGGLTRPTSLSSWSALLLSGAALTTASLLLLCPSSAHAQGGVPLWTNRFNAQTFSAPYIAVDGSGNVFLTGYSSDNANQVTIKYSNSGEPLWTNYFPSSSGFSYRPGLAVDSSGNVVVTGSSGTIKYSNTGVPLWTNLVFSSGPIALDSTGNVFVQDYFITRAFSNSGVLLWTHEYIGPGGRGNAWAIAVDSSDNVLVTGGSPPVSGGVHDYATVKYSNGGVPLWTNRFNGPGNSEDQALAIAVDNSGNVFVTGTSYPQPGTRDYVTIKYSGEGVPLWTNRYNGPANSEDEALAIAVDNSGNVFVTGDSGVSSGICCDYATIKYSGDGVPLWTRRYNGPGNSEDQAGAIAVDSSGNVFVTGHSARSDGFSSFATIAYSNAGVPLWTSRYNGPANGNDSASGIALDARGNVFISGLSWNGSNYDFVTIKYSSSVPPPRLAFQKLNNELVLSWTNAGFHLQTAPAATGPFTNRPAAMSPSTNPITAAQQFFRLKSD